MSVQIGSFKGSPTISLDAESKYPFTFGAKKAALIVQHFEDIKRFAEANPPGQNGAAARGPRRDWRGRIPSGGACGCEDFPCCGH